LVCFENQNFWLRLCFDRVLPTLLPSKDFQKSCSVIVVWNTTAKVMGHVQ
jgi:hypothetical protein